MITLRTPWFALLTLVAALTVGRADMIELSKHFPDVSGAFVIRNLQTGETQRYNPEQCAKRFSPCSTFKIVNSAIAVEEGVVEDENTIMKWDGKRRAIKQWNANLTLREAVACSAVPHFQHLAGVIGAERMQRYLNAIEYGNRDITSGLTTFWLNESLQISADDQVAFLEKFFSGQYDVFNEKTLKIVKKVLALTHTDRATLYGKTGTRGDRAGEGLGWFVGLVEGRDGTRHVFALNIEGKANATGSRAKAMASDILEDMGLL